MVCNIVQLMVYAYLAEYLANFWGRDEITILPKDNLVATGVVPSLGVGQHLLCSDGDVVTSHYQHTSTCGNTDVKQHGLFYTYRHKVCNGQWPSAVLWRMELCFTHTSLHCMSLHG